MQNSFDSAVGRRISKYINEEIDKNADVVTTGLASDYADYQSRCARIRALRDVAEELKKIEQELIAG